MALKMVKKSNHIHFLHVSGKRDYDMLKEIYKDTPQIELIDYAHDIYSLMKTAQVIIARSGASSLAEIVALKKPSILVPLPTAANNHQYFNAKILVDKGCALLVEDNDNLCAGLEKALYSLLRETRALSQIQKNLSVSPIPDPLQAAENCALQIEELAQE